MRGNGDAVSPAFPKAPALGATRGHHEPFLVPGCLRLRSPHEELRLLPLQTLVVLCEGLCSQHTEFAPLAVGLRQLVVLLPVAAAASARWAHAALLQRLHVCYRK